MSVLYVHPIITFSRDLSEVSHRQLFRDRCSLSILAGNMETPCSPGTAPSGAPDRQSLVQVLVVREAAGPPLPSASGCDPRVQLRVMLPPNRMRVSPVVSRRPCFMAVLHLLWLLELSHLLFCTVPGALRGGICWGSSYLRLSVPGSPTLCTLSSVFPSP